ncbi:MAG: TonB-dependent siderophore receptor [Burkholderiales bacterium]
MAHQRSTLQKNTAVSGLRLNALAHAAQAMLSCLALGTATHAAAQTVAPQEAVLPAVTITAPAARAGVAGFGDTPLAKLPMQAQVITQEQLQDRGGQHLSDLVSLDASISDSYNAAGYWDMLSIRGFTLDNKHNFRRDGLPINAETILPLDNKARIEVLKGTSGMQAGLSAPGGLVNLVVKRPEGSVRSVGMGWRSNNSVGAWADIGERFGPQQTFGLRINAAYEHLDPSLRSATGQRQLLAVAGDWRLNPDTLLEAEFESSRSSQPSQPGFSLLGNTLPAASSIDPRTNLNNQPRSQPVVLAGNTASLRLQQRLAAGWKFTAHAASQQLRSDDRLAYPYGCSAEGNYDRYCSDGTFDLYTFKTDGEHRRTDALAASVEGSAQALGLNHQLSVGMSATRFSARFGPQIYTYAGTGDISGNTVVPAGPNTPSANTDRNERTQELYLRDRIQLGRNTTAWLGLRHTRIRQDSTPNDGSSAPVPDSQAFTTPWLALSQELSPGRTAYASWGQGIETPVTPNNPNYVERGRPLRASRTHQIELGYKARPSDKVSYGVALFQIMQPAVLDNGSLFVIDGTQRRRGIEADAAWDVQAWRFDASGMVLDAKRIDSSINNDQRPTNVPNHTVKAQARYRVAQVPGLDLSAALVHEGSRMVLPDNSLSIPAWTRLDLGLSHKQSLGATQLTWRAGVTNATDKRAWRESPYQYGHVYLYPMAPRTWRLSLQADL